MQNDSGALAPEGNNFKLTHYLSGRSGPVWVRFFTPAAVPARRQRRIACAAPIHAATHCIDSVFLNT
jgi:hypothetical protein